LTAGLSDFLSAGMPEVASGRKSFLSLSMVTPWGVACSMNGRIMDAIGEFRTFENKLPSCYLIELFTKLF
jgi:hypothetical protein